MISLEYFDDIYKTRHFTDKLIIWTCVLVASKFVM